MWMIIEVTKDPALLQAIRQEVATAYLTDPETGSRTISVEKVVTLPLPLPQSVFTETLRLRVNFNLTRNVKEPITLDGFTMQKGSLLQAPSVVAHYDEATWASTGHSATEFWAERHVKYQDERDEAGNVARTRKSALAARPSDYFTFGMLLRRSPLPSTRLVFN
jgi:cytochrome P450